MRGLRIAVQVWREWDPTLNLRIDRTTGQPAVEPGDRLWRVASAGRAAVAAALKLAPAELTAFALGTGHTDALRHALAAGASSAVELLPDCSGSDGRAPLEALADWFDRDRPDLVIADRWAGLVAGRLGWSHLAGVCQLRVHADLLHAVRFLERGRRELVSARLPALVRLYAEALVVPYIARSRIQACSEQLIAQARLSAGSVRAREPGPLQLARPRTRLSATPWSHAASGSSRLQALLGSASARPTPMGDTTDTAPEQQADELVRYLMHYQFLQER
jgi:electron transfer flavoprotein alpha/beta subunit